MTTTCIESAQHTHTHVRLVISRVMKKSFCREGQGQGRSIRRDGPTRLRHKCSARETKSDARRHERFRWTCDWPSGKVWWHASLRTGRYVAVLHGLLDIVAAVAHALGVGSAVRQIRRNTCVITLRYSHWGRRDRIHGMSSHTENPPGIPSFQHIARRGVHWLDLRVATG